MARATIPVVMRLVAAGAVVAAFPSIVPAVLDLVHGADGPSLEDRQ